MLLDLVQFTCFEREHLVQQPWHQCFSNNDRTVNHNVYKKICICISLKFCFCYYFVTLPPFVYLARRK